MFGDSYFGVLDISTWDVMLCLDTESYEFNS